MADQYYYERLRTAERANLQAAAETRDRPTIDQFSGGVDGERHVASALDRLHEIDAAEEQGMTLPEYRQLVATDRQHEAYLASPAYAAELRRRDEQRRIQAGANQSIDARVAAVAYAHCGAETPLCIDYYGEGETQTANVRQRIGGAPKRCRINVATMAIE